MSFFHLFKYALTLPPHVAMAKAYKLGRRTLQARLEQFKDNDSPTYVEPGSAGTFPSLGLKLVSLDERLAPRKEIHAALAKKVLNHRFDLLGSGWVQVHHAMNSNGLAGHVYSPSTQTAIGNIPTDLMSPGNRPRSHFISTLIDLEYQPIDWQIDFISGYRWSEGKASGTLRYGHEPGVDVKVPWELGRLQHLPWLAWASTHAAAGEPGFEKPDIYLNEFRNQVLDFAASNPPRYGINWLCTMDVAFRAANLIMAMELLVAMGHEFDQPFLTEFHSLITAHGKHISENLEWHDHHRANHYLADIVGLLFVAAWLPRTPETDVWLAFCTRQLINEVERQFSVDGANFEASTSYHRMSAEMVIYATALVIGLTDDKRSALLEYDNNFWAYHPALLPAPIAMYSMPGRGGVSPFPGWYFERLERMAEFSIHISKPNGRVVQLGDNDNGRFFKMCPLFRQGESDLTEEHLDHRATVAAIKGLFPRADFSDFSGPDTELEATVIKALSGCRVLPSYLKNGQTSLAFGRSFASEEGDWPIAAETIIEPPDSSVFDRLEHFAYPDFGLFIWRSSRLFLSVRCGPIGQNGNGGHAHNDQLAIELFIDGVDWVADPGTYVYTPLPAERNIYRSIHAHAAPRIGKDEPAHLDIGLFSLEDRACARYLSFGPKEFCGAHFGYGEPVYRRVLLEGGRIFIQDGGVEPRAPVIVHNPDALRKLWRLDLPFSSGYGRQETL